MDEPLFDGVSAAIVFLGAAAVIVLRSAAADDSNSKRVRRWNLVGHLLLGIAVSLLLFRWIDSVTDLPSKIRPNEWRSGALAVACGIGLAAAVKAIIENSTVGRIRYFVITGASGTIAMCIASAWDWALLSLAFLSSGVALALRPTTRTDSVEPSFTSETQQREPALVVIVSAMLLLLLLGTWQHVLDHESRRKTRSPRYSAWPRVTAIRDAWQRSSWTANPQDDNSATTVSKVTSREQHIALGLGSLLVVIAIAARYRANCEPIIEEVNHAA